MKTMRRMLKLLPPAFLMRIWLNRRYGIAVKPSPWGGVAGFALALLPYAFTAALNVRVDSDCRLLKYFLPYGRMKRFVRLMYGMQVGNDAKDRGVAGAFRAAMPYGLVLWWDAEDAQGAAVGGAGKGHAEETPLRAAESPVPGGGISESARREFRRRDRDEVMALRLMILTAEGES